MTVKGLEGSTDLPIGKACKISRVQNGNIKKMTLHSKTYNYSGKDIGFTNLETWKDQAMQALNNEGLLKNPLIWNSGVYLWAAGLTKTIDIGISQAKSLIQSGSMKSTLDKLISWRNNI